MRKRRGQSGLSGGQRGAVLVQVSLMLVVLCGFCGLVVDYGVLWVARAQAQNAADAGALAGATALAFDSVSNQTAAETAAEAIAAENRVWLEPPVVSAVATVDSSCTVPDTPPPPARVHTCITVSVQRNQDAGNPLPTFFGKLVGIDNQGVRAHAVGTAAPANSSSCVWPLAIPDRWNENPPTGVWLPTSTFDRTPGPPLTPDTYAPPTATDRGSGFSLSTTTLNANVALTLTPADFSLPIGAGQFVPVQLPGNGFAANLAACNGQPVNIGDELPLQTGTTLAQVLADAERRRALDAGATWNTLTLRIQNSCAGTEVCGSLSPRLVALPVFDLNLYEAGRLVNAPVIRVVNFVGLFIRDVTASAVLGNLSTYPGQVRIGQPMVGYTSAFLRAPVLFR